MIRRFTTPTLTLYVKGVDISNSSNVYVTFEQENLLLTKEYDDFEDCYGDASGTTIIVRLTQSETASLLAAKSCRIQVNWTLGRNRSATEIRAVRITENLLNEEV